MLQIAQTGEGINNTKTELQSKCLHVSAFCSAFQSSLQQQPQMLHFYSSVSQKRPPNTRRSGSAPVPLPCHLVFTLRTSRGTPRTIYPVNIQPLAFCPPLHKESLCKCLSQPGGRLPACLPLLGTSPQQQRFHQNDFFCLRLSSLCLSFTPFPHLSLHSSPVNALKRFRGTLF